MTLCQQLSERMPAVALGRSRWSDAEEAHLASCADCRAEWSLVQLAGRLAASAPGIADPEAMGAKVRHRLEQARAAGRTVRRRALVGLGVAAAVAVALWSPAPANPPEPGVKPPASAPTPGPVAHAEPPRLDLPVPGIDEMSDSDLNDLLQAMDEPLAGTSTSPDDGAGLGDPDDRALAGALTVEQG